jgi:hypothetical protein
MAGTQGYNSTKNIGVNCGLPVTLFPLFSLAGDYSLFAPCSSVPSRNFAWQTRR